MSEYDTRAPVYDAWASDMLAREALDDESLEFVYVTRRP
jgi:hypothetical protein